jgi:ankyrin repeat protein
MLINAYHTLTACRSNNFNAVMALLEAGSDVVAKDNDSNTPMHLTCKLGYEHITEKLIEYGADIDARNNVSIPSVT